MSFYLYLLALIAWCVSAAWAQGASQQTAVRHASLTSPRVQRLLKHIGRRFPNTNLAASLLPGWASLVNRSRVFKGLDLNAMVAAPGSTPYCAVLADSRADPLLPVVLKHTMHMLGPSWSLTVFHTAANAAFLVRTLALSSGSPVRLVRVNRIDRDYYNALFMSSALEQALPGCEHLLVFQSDVVARKRNDLRTFLHYDYVGAPWSWCNMKRPYCYLGGNGGLSLRARAGLTPLLRELDCSRWDCVQQGTFPPLTCGVRCEGGRERWL